MRSLSRVPFAVVACALLTGCEHDPLPGTGGSAFRTESFLGEWTGTWTNTTLNSSGPASFLVTSGEQGVLELSVDLGGNVFGAGDPPEQAFVLVVGASAATLTAQNSPTYGQLSGRLEADGTVTATAVDVAVGTVRGFTLTGQWLANDVDLEATLTYAPGTTPETARAVVRLSKR